MRMYAYIISRKINDTVQWYDGDGFGETLRVVYCNRILLPHLMKTLTDVHGRHVSIKRVTATWPKRNRIIRTISFIMNEVSSPIAGFNKNHYQSKWEVGPFRLVMPFVLGPYINPKTVTFKSAKTQMGLPRPPHRIMQVAGRKIDWS